MGRSVRRADLQEKGDDDVVRKVKADLDAKGLGIPEAEIRKVMIEFLAKAVTAVESERK